MLYNDTDSTPPDNNIPAEVLGAWFAIRVRPRSEVRAHEELRLRGFESFLPQRRVRRQWSDRIRTTDVPVFPGYLFCKFELLQRFRILNVPGVSQILGTGTTPVPIAESEVLSLQSLVSSNFPLTPWPYLQLGQRVAIERGPLAGVEGIILRAEDGKSRVVVSVALLRRSVATEVDREWISAKHAWGS